MASIISVGHLSKTYRLGAIGGGTLQEDFARWWARIRRKPDPSSGIGHDHRTRQTGNVFRALEDVSFEVDEGEVLGVVGRNGAGKSTLLKILSQVTAPTSGRVVMHGRVASLLEVGTGFHPELTGRENVFLNGAILGMTKAEIRSKFDEIVAFSECAAFIDTPVKRYSSGMSVRLAFAVAAHLEPEILIVDEVLAVGDAQFQHKCLGRMSEVSRGGRTVLFVSHNMGAVRRLCKRSVLLDGGRVRSIGPSDDAIAEYLGGATASSALWRRTEPAPASSDICLEEVSLRNSAGELTSAFASTEPVFVTIAAKARVRTRPMQITFRLTNAEGIVVFTSANTDEGHALVALDEGTRQFRVEIPALFLSAGSYHVEVAAHVPRETLFDFVDSIHFSVEDTWAAVRHDLLGVVTPQLTWTAFSGSANVSRHLHPTHGISVGSDAHNR
ncbi:MAG: ABC transporter ATP-binding protein [Vicinamibacterales bacterium]